MNKGAIIKVVWHDSAADATWDVRDADACEPVVAISVGIKFGENKHSLLLVGDMIDEGDATNRVIQIPKACIQSITGLATHDVVYDRSEDGELR